MFSLDHKIALITGGGSGIGKAIAELFGKQGASVFILDLNYDAGQETASDIRASGFNATAI